MSWKTNATCDWAFLIVSVLFQKNVSQTHFVLFIDFDTANIGCKYFRFSLTRVRLVFAYIWNHIRSKWNWKFWWIAELLSTTSFSSYGDLNPCTRRISLTAQLIALEIHLNVSLMHCIKRICVELLKHHQLHFNIASFECVSFSRWYEIFRSFRQSKSMIGHVPWETETATGKK